VKGFELLGQERTKIQQQKKGDKKDSVKQKWNMISRIKIKMNLWIKCSMLRINKMNWRERERKREREREIQK
jgi:hypothetical protein